LPGGSLRISISSKLLKLFEVVEDAQDQSSVPAIDRSVLFDECSTPAMETRTSKKK
jgi:hypothetical protein